MEESSATGVGGDQANNDSARAGAAYAFVREGATWTQQAYLKASNTGAFDNFGRSVAIFGKTAVMTAPHEDSSATGINGDQEDNSVPSSGAAYIFTIGLPASAPVLMSITRDSASSASLSWVSNPGRSYAIEKSTDLVNWAILVDDYPDGGASGMVSSFTDEAATGSQVFYRVSEESGE